MIVFVYGTLKRGHRNHCILENAQYLGKAQTRPIYRLYKGLTFPMMIHSERGVRVKGEIYEVDEAMLSRLDHLEGTPWLYKRETIGLLNGCQVQGYIFQQKLEGLTDCGNFWTTEEKAKASTKARNTKRIRQLTRQLESSLKQGNTEIIALTNELKTRKEREYNVSESVSR